MKKIGLDDFLIDNSAEEVKNLPKDEVRKQTIDEMINDATPDIAPDDRKRIYRRIAKEKSKSERAILINKLAKKIGIGKGEIKNDIKKITEKSDKKQTQIEKLLEKALKLPLFHDQNRDAYTFIENEVLLLRSKKFKQWLAYQFYLAEGKAPNSDSLSQTVKVLEGKAIFEGPQHKLFNRIAVLNEGNVANYYYLGNGEVIKITEDGWSVEKAPILFISYSHQQQQVKPIGGGDPWRVFEFLNIDKKNQLLVLVYIVSCFVPEIPHPIFHPHGAQGSGKTSLCKVIKKIVDPSIVETLITPRDIPQLVQVVDHHHVCLFDNLSNLQAWMSDILAQACTGGGFSKRQLFTDNEDIVYQVKRCIGLNGINLLISKADLMDRSLLLHLDRIDPSKRMEEEKLWKNFDKAKPEILGGILDVLSKAMKIYKQTELANLPRMADFARWGYAITEALGRDGSEFLKDYQSNIDRQNEEVIQNNTLAQSVFMLLKDKDEWDGTIKEAWEELHEQVNPDGDKSFLKHDYSFPKTPRTLRKHLERIKTNLLDYGISFHLGERTERGYEIFFCKNSNFNSFSTFASKINKNNEFNPEANMNEMNKAEFSSSDNALKTSADEGHEQNEPKKPNTQKEDKKITLEGELDEV